MFKGINHVVTILPSQTLTYTSPTTSFDTFMIPSAIADRAPQLPTTAFLSCAYLKKTNESLISLFFLVHVQQKALFLLTLLNGQ